MNVRQKDGHSKKEHLLSAYRQSGVMDPELANAPKLPTSARYLWDYFKELSRHRVNSGFGPTALQFVDIEAWARLSRTRLDPWELNAILRLDAAFIASLDDKATQGS